MRSSLKTILAATAVAASAAFFGAGTAQGTVAFQGPFTFSNGVGTGTLLIGDKEFLNFSCLGSTGANCALVTYTNSAAGFGVQFNPSGALDFTDASNQFRDVTLEFEVVILPGQPFSIADFLLVSNAQTSGSAVVTDNLQICTTQLCSAGSVVLTALLSGNGLSLPDTLLPCLVGPGNCTYTDLWIIDDIHTSSGDAPGTVDVSLLNKVVTQVPEPASLLLIGAALLGMGVVRRRGSK